MLSDRARPPLILILIHRHPERKKMHSHPEVPHLYSGGSGKRFGPVFVSREMEDRYDRDFLPFFLSFFSYR